MNTNGSDSEERYRQIAQAIPQIVWVTSSDGKLTYTNQKWKEYTGLDVDDREGDRWQKVLHPEDAERIRESWQWAIAHNEPYETQVRIRRADGVYRWFLSRGIPVHNDQGQIIEWVGTNTDIEEQKHVEESLQFLARASEILSESLDYERTLRQVAALAVPQIADWCGVEIMGEDGKIKQLAVEHVDPSKVDLARELSEKYPTDPNSATGVPQVIRTGKSEVYLDITDEMLVHGAVDEEHLRLIRYLGLTSIITVPLVAREIVFGALSLVTAETKRRFTETDVRLAEDLGRRAGIAVDNAWLYKKAQEEILEREETANALRNSEMRFRTMIEQSPLGIQLFDLEGNCIEANQAWEELWGAKREDLQDYNIRRDPQLAARGMKEFVDLAYNGESVVMPPFFYDPAEIGKPGRDDGSEYFFIR